MQTLPLRSVFSSILLGHLGLATALTGCFVVVDESDDPDYPPGSSGAAGSSGRAGGAGRAGASGQAGSAGAGGSGGSAAISTAGFDPFSCEPLTPGALAALDVDAVEIWQNLFRDGVPSKFESEGVPCEAAPDRAACLAALEQARAEPWDGSLAQFVGGNPPTTLERLVTTDGGAVAVIDSYEALAARLGPVDALGKLRFVARYRASDVECEHVRRTAAGFELVATVLLSDCPVTYQRQLIQVTEAGEVTVIAREAETSNGACAGRRPAGLAPQVVGSGGAAARFLERQAYLEAASVEAFERLARELEALGAPAELVAEARRARADEVRHHALLVSLGRRFDDAFACQAPAAAPAAARSLFAFALENAVEGCVRETWGALLAHHQAARASDGAVRFASTLIADDETRHAELAWATHRWARERLNEAARRGLDEAMARAAGELLDEVAAGDGLAAGERAELGLPSPDEARALVGQLREALWAETRRAA